MSKYIIRGCKALISNDICELYSQKGIHLMTYCYCKDTNCKIKQIVELCKSACIDCSSIKGVTYTQCKDLNNCKTAKILKLLDIQEVK